MLQHFKYDVMVWKILQRRDYKTMIFISCDFVTKPGDPRPCTSLGYFHRRDKGGLHISCYLYPLLSDTHVNRSRRQRAITSMRFATRERPKRASLHGH